jgi:hypothetical protein
VIGGGQQVDANEFLEFPLHAPHGDVQHSSRDDIGSGELFPCALVGGDFHVFKETTKMFHGHGDAFARFRTVTDELDGLPFRLRVLDELFEPPSPDEELNGILQMDTVIGGVAVAFVESTVLCLVDLLPLL